MNEKDLLNKVKNSAENVTPPDALSPDAIEKMLSQNASAQNRPEQENQGRKNKKRKLTYYITHYGSMAAVCVLAVTAAWQAKEISRLSGKVDSAKIQMAEKSEGQVQPSPDSDLLTAEPDQAETTSSHSSTVPADAFTYADSYEEIYRTLQEISAAYGYVVLEDTMEYSAVETRELYSQDTGALAGSASNADAESTSSGSGTADFSDTNIQEAGVDEADIIKTDGTYIYILRGNGTLAIVRADGASSETVSITEVIDKNSAYIQEMYLDGDLLHIIAVQEQTSLNRESDVYYTSTNIETVLHTYDIADRSAPVLTGTVTQEGSYTDSRKVGSFIYLFTSYYPDIQSTYDESTIIPRINGTAAEASDFYLPDSMQDTAYLVISSVDSSAPNDIVDSKILVSGASHFYVSTESIYIANETYTSGTTRTELTKFHYADGQITGVAAASIKGYLNDSFSLNEYNGYLRVVTTYYGNSTTALRNKLGELTDLDFSVSGDWEEHNGLFIFDENMQQTGSIEDLAEGETIRSARFFGDTGYFVTFRQTDPLFSADLSDPASPQILGELKISGFSSYLHFYGDDLLLGIGYEADENTGITSGLKLSMFDISDPANVTETDRLILPGITWCPAIEDYKSILVQPEKNLIGFFCDNRYLTFSWTGEEGFTQEMVYDFYSDMLTGEADYTTVRGLYIDDTFYVAGETFLVSFDMEKEFEKLEAVRIAEE